MVPLRFFVSFVLIASLGIVGASTSTAQPEPAGAPIALNDSADAFFMQPVWAPNSDRLAVTGPGYTGIWLLSRSGGVIQQVTDAPSAGFSMRWAPDGSALVSRVTRYENRRRYHAVTVFDLAEDTSRLLTDYRTSMPALPRWTPDGRQVILPGSNAPEMLTVKQDTSDGRGTDTPVYAAHGRRLQVIHPTIGSVQVRNVSVEGRILNLMVAPDRSKIAFEVMGGHLYVMNPDGSERVDLGRGHRPAFSPDGQWVVFMRTEDDGHRFTVSELYAARTDGSGRVQLTDTPNRLEMNPDWSPDGSAIAFDDHEGRIWILPMTNDE